MNIELLKKYNMLPLEEYQKRFGDNIDTEMTYYKTFLIQTDHIPLKIFETFIENMAAATLTETFAVIVSFFKDIKVVYSDVLLERKSARKKINELEELLKEG